MNLEQAINNAYSIATGAEEQLETIDDDYVRLKMLANMFSQDWSSEVLSSAGERWESLEQVTSLGIIAEDLTKYALPNEDIAAVAFKPTSDPAGMIIQVDGSKAGLKAMDRGHFMSSRDSLIFSYDAKTDSVEIKSSVAKDHAGAELQIITYRVLPKLENATDLIEVDNPNWLVYMMAAEYVRPDQIMGGQYGNLVALASNLMEAMKSDHRAKRLRKADLRG